LPLVAKYAREWNGVFITPEKFSDLSSRLDELLVANGRQPEDVRRSLMLGTVFGRDQKELDKKMRQRTLSIEELRERGLIVGTPTAFAEQLHHYADAGVQRVMLQWIDLDDLTGLEKMAAAVL
jgi:alkanesulfonate monooxygenase SsuD/methylene tetrahydromethanopterin reductase-like flavin-dependent oxidoreductase (luciferase family)